MYATLSFPAAQDLNDPRRVPLVRVRSADELRTALRHGREYAVTVDGTGMDRVLRLDAARGLVELQAATPWAELARYLKGHKVSIEAFARMPKPVNTVGEAVSQAAPGPDGLPVSAHVIGITLVMPDGTLRRADRHGGDKLFRLALGGHGVIGVLYSVTLSTASLQASAAGAVAPVELAVDAAADVNADCAVECLLPPDALDAYLRKVRTILDERRIPLHGIVVRRYRPDAYALLNWARREWAGVEVRFGVKSTICASVLGSQVRRALLRAAISAGGSFPIRDTRDATRAQLEACYPMVHAFLADKRRGDQAERLQNAWYRDLIAKIRCEPIESRWGS